MCVPTFLINTDEHSLWKKIYLLLRPDDNNHSSDGQGLNLDAVRGDPNSKEMETDTSFIVPQAYYFFHEVLVHRKHIHFIYKMQFQMANKSI